MLINNKYNQNQFLHKSLLKQWRLLLVILLMSIFTVNCADTDKTDKTDETNRTISYCNDPTQSTGFNGGDGTENTPYIICTDKQLAKISESIENLNQHYQLEQNIVFPDDATPEQIGTACGTTDAFTGTFDGGGYTISNIGFTSATRDIFVTDLFGCEENVNNLILKTNISSYCNTSTSLVKENTSTDSFIVCNSDHLNLVALNLTESFTMFQDINLNNIAFTPIAGTFTGNFNGSGYKIQNLIINVNTKRAGLFEELASEGSIQNLGLDGLDIRSTNTSGSTTAPIYIGSLVANMMGGTIENCYATDTDSDIDLQGSTGDNDYIGGMVGNQIGGFIIANYTTSSADGGTGNNDIVGGLVGYKNRGSIIVSYATGNANGGNGENKTVGGLVGEQDVLGGNIIASYSTGNVYGSDDGYDSIGGLIGAQKGGSIIASYATGNIYGGGNDALAGDYAGGLIGYQNGGVIIASYTTGNADGGNGNMDSVGALIGFQEGALNIVSYGFGMRTGEEDDGTTPTLPSGVNTAIDLTSSNAGTQWGGTNSPWDFGTNSQTPVLKYITGATTTGSVGSSTVSYTCNSNFLPTNIKCGDIIPRQNR